MTGEQGKWSALALAVILLLSLVLNLTGLTRGLPGEERGRLYLSQPKGFLDRHPGSAILQSFHTNEQFILMAIARMRPLEFDFNPHFFSYPGLFIYLVAAGLLACSLFGFIVIEPAKAFYLTHLDLLGRFFLVGRVISALFAVSCVVFLYLLVRRRCGERVALWAAFFLSASPVFFINAHYMIADVPQLLWIILGFEFSLCALENGRTRDYLLAGLMIGLAASTKYTGGLVCVVLVLAHLTRSRREGRNLVRSLLAGRLALAGLIALVVFVAWNPYFILSSVEAWDKFLYILRDAFGVLSQEEDHLYWYFAGGSGAWYYARVAFFFGLGPVMLLAAAGGLVRALWGRDVRVQILAGFALMYFVLISFGFVRFMRYLLPLVPVLAVLAGLGLNWIVYKLADRWSQTAAVTAMVLVVVQLIPAVIFVQAVTRPDVRLEVSRWIREKGLPEAIIALTADEALLRLPLDPDRYRLIYPGLDQARLAQAEPDFIIISEYEWQPLASIPSGFERDTRMARLLTGEEVNLQGLRYRRRLFYSPTISWRIEPRNTLKPRELAYDFPVVAIYEKVGQPSEREVLKENCRNSLPR